MKVLRFLLEKEFKQLLRNPIFIGVIIYFPIMVLLIFPWAINYDLEGLRISIVNHDTGSYAHRLISKIEGTPSFEIASVQGDVEDAIRDIERSRATMILVIPEDFGHTLTTEKRADVQVMINSVDGTQATIGKGYINALLTQFGQEVLQEESGMRVSQLSPLEIRPVYSYNESLNYKYFMLPGFLVIMLTFFCGIFPAMSIVGEKEIGTLQQINVTPVKRYTFIIAKIIPFWVLAIIVISISVPVIYWVYGLTFEGNFLLYLGCVLLFAITMSFMGVIISNIAETLQQSMFITIFFILIFFLISGLFTPVNAMPLWAQVIAYANPLTYFNKLTRMMYLKGAGVTDIWVEIVAILGFLVVFGVTATLTHNKRSI